MEQGGQSLYSSVEVRGFFDSEVTKDGFSEAFDDIAEEAEPDDVFVFYLAGHGITNSLDGDYYFIPSEFRYTGRRCRRTDARRSSAD